MVRSQKIIRTVALIGAVLLVLGASCTVRAADVEASGYGLLFTTQLAASASTGHYYVKTSSSVPFSTQSVPMNGSFISHLNLGYCSVLPLSPNYTYEFEVEITHSTSVSISSSIPSGMYIRVSEKNPQQIYDYMTNLYGDTGVPENPIVHSGLAMRDLITPTITTTGSTTNGPLKWHYSFIPNSAQSSGSWLYFDIDCTPLAASPSVPSSYSVTIAKLTNNQTGESISQEQLQEITEALGTLSEKQDLTNEELDELNSKVDQLPDDFVEAQKRADEEAAAESQAETDEFIDEFGDNFDNPSEYIDLLEFGKMLWDSVSTTRTRNTLVVPAGEWGEHTFWEEYTINFSSWLNNPLLSAVITFGKILISYSLLKWILTFWYRLMIAIFIPSAETNIMSVLFRHDPLDPR